MAIPMEEDDNNPVPITEQLAQAAAESHAREQVATAAQPQEQREPIGPSTLNEFIEYYGGSAEWHGATVHQPAVNPPAGGTARSPSAHCVLDLCSVHAVPAALWALSVLRSSRRCPTRRLSTLSLLHAHPCGGSLR